MILIDFTQMAYSSILLYLSTTKETTMSLIDLKTMILRSIKSCKLRLQKEYGKNVVLAYDSSYTWRKNKFKFYKSNRKKKRDDRNVDWDDIFSKLNSLKEDLKLNFPYIVIDVNLAEADDVIAVVSRFRGNDEKIVICSRDHDFFQLHDIKNVIQFDIVSKKMIKCETPKDTLFEHIIRGDVGDGIPNILSDDDTFNNTEKRQARITTKKIEHFKSINLETDLEDSIFLNFKRNQELIDFNYIPDSIKENIENQYTTQLNNIKKVDLYSYFMKNRLSCFLDSIGDFI